MPRQDGVDVAPQHAAVGTLRPGTGAPGLEGDRLAQVEDLLAVDRLTRDGGLESVELWRVVRPCHLHAPVDPRLRRREVERRRRHHPDVHRDPPGGGEAGAECGGQRTPRRAVVAPHGKHRLAGELLPGERADRLPERPRERGRQLAVDQAADVVLPEDGLRCLHDALVRSAKCEVRGG